MTKITLSKIGIDDEVRDAVMQVLASGRFILGENIRNFEKNLAKYFGVDEAICTSSGTAAIFLSLLAAGIKPKDEVIAPSFSFIATATPILHAGGQPVFADIDEGYFTIDTVSIDNLVTKKTKAMIPVHLYGHPANMDELMKTAKDNDITVIEDACQAHGALYRGRKIGSIGDAACLSFYPSKNLTVCGDGGAILTNDKQLAMSARMLRDHGRIEKYRHDSVGYNFRMSELHASIGNAMLRKLDEFNSRRRQIAKIYSDELGKHVRIPFEASWAKHVYHMYVIRHKKRDKLREFLLANEIETGIHYPIPIHLQPALQGHVVRNVPLLVTEKACNEVLSLPMHPYLTDNEALAVAEKVRSFVKN